MRNPDLDYLTRRWPGLLDYRFDGTPRPWRELFSRWIPDEDQVGMADGHQAPVRISTLVLILEIEHDAKAWLAQAGQPATGQVPDLLGWLDQLIPAEAVPGSFGGEVALWAGWEARRVKGHLGEVPDGQRLKAVCPWCWHQSLVVRCLPLVSRDPEPFIRCESGVCAPGVGEVGVWGEGLPCWPMVRWEWLSERLDQAFEKEFSGIDESRRPATNGGLAA